MKNYLLFSIILFAYDSANPFDVCSLIHTPKECVNSFRQHFKCNWCTADSSCKAIDSADAPCPSSKHPFSTNFVGSLLGYDPDVAWLSALFSAVAYSKNASEYLEKAFPGQTFDDVTHVQHKAFSAYVATWKKACTIIVAVKGTDGTSSQLYKEAFSLLTKSSVSISGGGTVEKYFYQGFDALWNSEGLKNAVVASLKKHPEARLLVTGHSLGGAIASIISFDLAYRAQVAKENLLLYTFGMPRVGNYKYAAAHDAQVKLSFRITQEGDPVPHIPTCSLLGCSRSLGPYHHGTEVYYPSRSTGSNYKTGWKLCRGHPVNEDSTCANSCNIWDDCFAGSKNVEKCIQDHKNYFGLTISAWWKEPTKPQISVVDSRSKKLSCRTRVIFESNVGASLTKDLTSSLKSEHPLL